MRNRSFVIQRSGVFFAVFTAIGLHYLLNPSESMGAPLISKLIRIFAATAVLTVVFFVSRPSKNVFRLVAPFVIIFLWFLLINFPDNPLGLLTLYLFVGFGFLASGLIFYDLKNKIIARGISFVLIFWVSSLFLQLLLYLFTSEIFDFHRWLHPWSEARVHDIGNFIRFTGVLIEPGTYANWVYGLIVLRGLAGDSLFDRTSIISILSILLTLSAWGTIAVLIYLAIYAWNITALGNSKTRLKILASIVCALVVTVSTGAQFEAEIVNVIQYFAGRSELADASGTAKVEAYAGFFSMFPRILALGLPVDFDFCNGCLSPQDAGLFVNLTIRSGLVFTLAIFMIIGLCIRRHYGLLACLSIIPLLFAKYFYFEPLFWMLFGFCFLDVFSNKSRQNIFLSPSSPALVKRNNSQAP